MAINYDALEQAGYEYRVSCRLCGAVLNTTSASIIGVCTNCIAGSNSSVKSIKRPRYRNGNGKTGPKVPR